MYSEDIDDLLSYLNVISLGGWGTLLATMIWMGFVVYMFERGKYEVPEAKLRGIIEGMWIVFSGFFLSLNKRIKKSASRILLVWYFAVSVMFTALFTASVWEAYRGRFMTITGPDDLYGKTIITIDAFKDDLATYEPRYLDF